MGIDYNEAHNKVSSEEGAFSQEVNGMSDLGTPGTADGFTPTPKTTE